MCKKFFGTLIFTTCLTYVLVNASPATAMNPADNEGQYPNSATKLYYWPNHPNNVPQPSFEEWKNNPPKMIVYGSEEDIEISNKNLANNQNQ